MVRFPMMVWHKAYVYGEVFYDGLAQDLCL